MSMARRAALPHLHCSMLRLARCPLALTQPAALESLHATANHCAGLPAIITALSRPTELRLGRVMDLDDPLQLQVKRSVDVRMLGDLCGSAALRELSFNRCQVMLCTSLLGAAGHASLAILCSDAAHPAPECAPMVLQLNQDFRRLGRGSMVTFICKDDICARWALGAAQGRAPCQNSGADLIRVSSDVLFVFLCVRGCSSACVVRTYTLCTFIKVS